MSSIIYEKENFWFNKVDDTTYQVSFIMEDKNISVFSLIDFGFLKVIYELNKNLFEHFQIDMNENDNNEINLFILCKHILADFGYPQKYLHLNIKKIKDENTISFIGKTNHHITNQYITDSNEIINIFNLFVKCIKVDNCKTHFSFIIELEEETMLNEFVEKTIGILLHKVFLNTKKMIDSL